jgi:small subunit ribosomal protein S14
MAKKSMIARELKRANTVKKFATKRAELKATIVSTSSTEEQVWEAQS